MANVIAQRACKKAEIFRIVTGVVAIVAAAASLIIQIVNLLRGIATPIVALLNMSSGFAILASLVLCAVYVLGTYGKRDSHLFGIAVSIFAIGKMLESASVVAIIGIRKHYFQTSDIYFIRLVEVILISAIFVIMAIQFFIKQKTPFKFLPIVAVCLAVLSFIVRLVLNPVFVSRLIEEVFNLLFLTPFLLFVIFCPAAHRKAGFEDAGNPLQAQKKLIEKLNLQLQCLKKEFEAGKTTQQEYEDKRKKIIDKL